MSERIDGPGAVRDLDPSLLAPLDEELAASTAARARIVPWCAMRLVDLRASSELPPRAGCGASEPERFALETASFMVTATTKIGKTAVKAVPDAVTDVLAQAIIPALTAVSDGVAWTHISQDEETWSGWLGARMIGEWFHRIAATASGALGGDRPTSHLFGGAERVDGPDIPVSAGHCVELWP
jgi:hypothetical protein